MTENGHSPSDPKTFDSRTRMCESALDFIGCTPLLKLRNISKNLPAQIACKIEYCNPGCSIKDRAALRMIEAAEQRGVIRPGVSTLIEVTSGNMGIALAFICAIKGYSLVLIMPSHYNVERRSLLKAYGAELLLTDPAVGVVGALKKAQDLKALLPNSHILNQFENPANISAHYETTGPEIWAQTGGKVDICCFGVGSGGTVMGVGRYLREKNPAIRMYAVEPYESSVINGFPACPHKIMGMGASYIPPILSRLQFEEALRVRSDDAIDMARQLAREEGLLVGISSGANVCAAIELAKRPENAGKLIVTSCGDFGERYLTTELYKEIKDECEQMKETTLEEDVQYLKTKGFKISP